MPVPQITPEELATRLAQRDAPRPLLLDVRSHGEHELVALPDSVLIPLHELDERAGELDGARGREVVVYCHLGVRSLSGAAILMAHGFNAKSLTGGIDLYARLADPTLPRY